MLFKLLQLQFGEIHPRSFLFHQFLSKKRKGKKGKKKKNSAQYTHITQTHRARTHTLTHTHSLTHSCACNYRNPIYEKKVKGGKGRDREKKKKKKNDKKKRKRKKRKKTRALAHLVLLLGHHFSSIHDIASKVGVANITESQWATTVEVSREFCCAPLSTGRRERKKRKGQKKLTNSSFGIVGRIELHHTGSSRPSIGFVLDFRTLHLSNSIEQLNQIIVASGPWELDKEKSRQVHGLVGVRRAAYIAHVDGVALFTAATSVIGEVVWRDSSAKISRRTASTGASKAASKTRAASAIAEAPTATSKASGTPASSKGAATAATAKDGATSATKASTAGTAHAAKAGSRTAGKTVFPDFEWTALPVVAIELGDGVPCIFRSFERNDAATLGTTIGADVDIGTDHSTWAPVSVHGGEVFFSFFLSFFLIYSL